LLAADLIRKECANVHFTFIGNGVDVERLKIMAVNMKLTNVAFFPRIPQSQLKRYLRSSDVLLVHLKDDPIFRRAIPSKTQSYLAAGKPVLMGVRGDAADLIWKSKAGLIFEPENVASLVEKIKIMAGMKKEELEKMGQNGIEFYKAILSFQTALDKFVRLFGSFAK
jgi:glycosyltransferase involved in cell wall biosynthesis